MRNKYYNMTYFSWLQDVIVYKFSGPLDETHFYVVGNLFNLLTTNVPII